MKRRILALVLALMLALASTAVFAEEIDFSTWPLTDEQIQALREDPFFMIGDKKPEEVTGKFIYWGWDEAEFTAIQNGMMAIYPNIEPVFVNVAYDDYLMKVTTAVASGAEVPDVMAMDVGFLGKFYELGICDDLTAAPYNLDPSVLVDFTAGIAKDFDGVLRATPNIGPAGCTYYKRDLAIKYFGTDDPEVIGEKISTWDKFIETGIELKEKSNGECYMIAGLDSVRQAMVRQVTDPWVDPETGTLYTETVFKEMFDTCQRINEAGIAGPYDADTAAWNAAIAGKDVFCYVGAMFYENWVIGNNDPEGRGNWAVVRSPGKPYTAGGIYWGVYSGAQNKDAAAAYIKYEASEFGSAYKYYEQTFYPPTKLAYELGYLDQPSEVLGGQKPVSLYVSVIEDMGENVPKCLPEDGLMNNLTGFYLRAMQAGQGTADELLAQMTDEFISRIPEYHR